ncbi:MAG: hypothetical protein MUE41_00980 [Gemmatimonadaceae bacterium]|jgi:hypothetical protein|nr:hypothetical protein [Gemmatimonadaceae bacterium]
MRGRFDGVGNIVRFNWPMFVSTALVAVAALVAAAVTTSSIWRVAFVLLAAGLAIGTAVSLVVSHVVYDRSDLYRFAWLGRAVGAATPRDAVFCQTGFDECSDRLRAWSRETRWVLLDHFDPVRMTEPSIRRARAWCPPAPGTLTAPFDRWPVHDQAADLVIGMLAIHELRACDERTAWFLEAHRTTRAQGRVIVVEHVRDLANALAFGPGALHFHSVATWRRSWERAGLRLRQELPVTPWVRAFVLERA